MPAHGGGGDGRDTAPRYYVVTVGVNSLVSAPWPNRTGRAHSDLSCRAAWTFAEALMYSRSVSDRKVDPYVS